MQITRKVFVAIAAAAACMLARPCAADDANVAGSTAADAPSDIACAAGTPVRIRGASAADARLACEGARRALAYLATVGLEPPPDATIETAEQMPGELRGRAVGCYLRDSRRIMVLTYEAFRAGGPWFRLPPDEELYRAAASHEIAHAAVACATAPTRLPLAAQEYVAYVVMFATMEPKLRSRLLAKFPGGGFESSLQINDLSYLVDPIRFAVDAWRHFRKRRDGAAWLREVVDGRVVPSLPSEGP